MHTIACTMGMPVDISRRQTLWMTISQLQSVQRISLVPASECN